MKLKESKKLVEISFQMMKEKEGVTQIMLMVQDVTSMKNLQKERTLQRMKTVYFCSVAHDLKTPINSIMASNEHMISKYQKEQQTSRLLKITKTSCHFLLRIIEDITDLSKIELKSFSLNNGWF